PATPPGHTPPGPAPPRDDAGFPRADPSLPGPLTPRPRHTRGIRHHHDRSPSREATRLSQPLGSLNTSPRPPTASPSSDGPCLIRSHNSCLLNAATFTPWCIRRTTADP